MEDDMINPYAVLGLDKGPYSTDAEIKKAYRLLALQKHPDKNRDNPQAANEFSQLQRAYELLSDAQARSAVDNLHRAQSAQRDRQAGRSAKRQQMQQDLERREQAWSSERNEETTARARLKVELERLRHEAAERQAQLEQQQKQQQAAAAASSNSPGLPSEHVQRTLKVSWDKKAGDYTAEAIREALGVHGQVEDVVVRQGKKKSRGSALVTMASLPAARAAATSVHGNLNNPLLVLPVSKVAPDAVPSPSAGHHAASVAAKRFSAEQSFSGSLFPSAGAATFSSFPAVQPRSSIARTAGPQPSTASRDFESVTLMKMRQAAERTRAIAQMQEEEEDNAAAP
ncbi:hypothetical protein WJX72_004437 [[Myrmecia] bisecta]|uniref:J domain-containing protein n=1 Tax=[Myrmecia] bisecta TaxID=41462 RepID=A0AAW1R6G0_9CHLO